MCKLWLSAGISVSICMPYSVLFSLLPLFGVLWFVLSVFSTARASIFIILTGGFDICRKKLINFILIDLPSSSSFSFVFKCKFKKQMCLLQIFIILTVSKVLHVCFAKVVYIVL